MGELKFIGKRVVNLIVMLLGVATLVFILTKMIPGDPVVANLSQRALNDPEIVAAYRARHGLDQPLIVQYFYYIRNLLHFDLGTSIRIQQIGTGRSGDQAHGEGCQHNTRQDQMAQCIHSFGRISLQQTVQHIHTGHGLRRGKTVA